MRSGGDGWDEPGGGWSAGGERGRFGRFFGRVLEDPDNPLGWSVKLFRLLGIDVRIHLVTVVVFVGMLLSSFGLDNWGFGLMLATTGALFGLVLIHEFGHCLACRAAGGEADRIVMLPFGGLALTMPPASWKAHLVTTIGGPAVHPPIGLAAAALLAVFGQGQAIVFNPLAPGATLATIAVPGEPVAHWLLSVLWTVHYVNALLFLFNVLLVFFPFDGGRIVQELLWWKMGYRRSMAIAVHVGLVGAVLLGVVALIAEQVTLVAIAFFGGITCWAERQRLRTVDEVTGFAPGELDGEVAYAGSLAGGMTGGGVRAGGADGDDAGGESRASKRERRRMEQEAADRAELDRVLEKIGRDGRDALTRKERKFLEAQTAKRRGGGR